MADENMGLGPANPYLGTQNPYLQSIIDLTSKDMTDAYGRTTVAAQNAAALRSGSFGNSGLDEMQRADQRQLQTSIGDAASKLRFNDYTQQQQMYQWDQNQRQNQGQFDATLANNKDQFGQTLANNKDQFGRTLDQNQSQFNDQFGRSVFNDAYSQNVGNLQLGMGMLGTMRDWNAQDLATATGNRNAPLNYLGQFSNIANAIGGNGGVSTSVQGTTSNPLMTAAGGAQLGNSFANWWGKQNNTSPTTTAVNQPIADSPYANYTNENTAGYTTGGGGGWW